MCCFQAEINCGTCRMCECLTNNGALKIADWKMQDWNVIDRSVVCQV